MAVRNRMRRDGALCTVSGERDMGENNCWRAHKGAVSEAEMDAHCCVGGQQVQQCERMPYATLRQAKSSKRRRRSTEKSGWFPSALVFVWPPCFSSGCTLFCQSSLKIEDVVVSVWKQEKGLKEEERRDRDNE